ncbi:MAG: hypothetical protein E5X40_24050 [Mesorhizobium sp.]|nr:UvrD-helicase domain-containing protein [Mesorhizobium sp.]RUV80778.1 hypothetical protein EOA88_21230 [Mesorhizobium sp. M5C.F.Ca.IN.020.14.1.1]TIQ70032.1 MAG: hypothetical protein E5X40_24050 [Mesorhizobium sp.]
MSVAYLENLNIEQRRAVEHGVVDAKAMIAAPLLIIAGPGSGKTNTLAHRWRCRSQPKSCRIQEGAMD